MTDELRIEWRDDWDLGCSHFTFYGEAYADRENGEPDTCEWCAVYAPNGDLLASLGCIDDATDAYRAEIESELLAEARYELESPAWEATKVLCDY